MNRKWTLSKQSFCKLLGHWQKRIVSKTKCIWPKLLKPQLCLCCLLFPPVEPTMAEAPKYGLVIRSDGSVLMGDEGMPTFDSGLAAVLSSVMKVVQKKRKSARRRRPTTPLQLPLPLIPVSMIWRKPMAAEQDDKGIHVPAEEPAPKKKKQNKRKKGRKV